MVTAAARALRGIPCGGRAVCVVTGMHQCHGSHCTATVTRARMTSMERCPTCRGILPPVKVCPNCGREFYRSEGGRQDALYCSRKCADAARQRRHRQRAKQ